MSLSDVKARRGELTADSLQLTASVGYGMRNTPERLAVSRRSMAEHDLPRAKPPHIWADGLRPAARALWNMLRAGVDAIAC